MSALLMEELIAAQREVNDRRYERQIIMTSPRVKAAYAAALKRSRRWRSELESLPRHAWLRRYQLRRKLGASRLGIIWPRAQWYRTQFKSWRYDRRHRADPDYYG